MTKIRERILREYLEPFDKKYCDQLISAITGKAELGFWPSAKPGDLAKDGQERIEEIHLVTRAVQHQPAKAVMEIGVGWGLTTFSLAESVLKCGNNAYLQTVDFKDTDTTSKQMSAVRQENIRKILEISGVKNWSHSDIGTNAWFEKELRSKAIRKYDVVFIDGDHSYEQTKSDWLNVEQVRNENCLVFFHDLTKRTQGLNYPHVALKCFEEIDDKKYYKRIVNTRFQLGFLTELTNTAGIEWFENICNEINVEIKEV
jgi:predicted O-methyltransferase YrrM